LHFQSTIGRYYAPKNMGKLGIKIFKCNILFELGRYL
jgi:hypothetical protein